MAINAKGTMLVLRAVEAAMAKQKPRMHQSPRHGTWRSRGRDSIVVLRSINGTMVAPGMFSYVASKYAVIGIVKTASIDNVKNHIRVNNVAPAYTETAMWKRV
ncbi:reductase [Aspergillus alliaceus]|uniref:Reductase n=1 Tax=Petromyces alliaceus TaxID=209559 RepID=A0A8H6AAI1_PETAA|nr:reductase [Aspergillus burnettii]